MFELIKKIFVGLLTGRVSASNIKKCMSLGSQKCMIQKIGQSKIEDLNLSVFDMISGINESKTLTKHIS